MKRRSQIRRRLERRRALLENRKRRTANTPPRRLNLDDSPSAGLRQASSLTRFLGF